MVNHFNKSNSQKKIVVAMDSFKGSLTSLEAGNAVRDGILERYPDVDVQIFPVADGGEGTVEALTFGKEHVQTRTIPVTGQGRNGSFGEIHNLRAGRRKDGSFGDGAGSRVTACTGRKKKSDAYNDLWGWRDDTRCHYMWLSEIHPWNWWKCNK